jgi:hypothetical protein
MYVLCFLVLTPDPYGLMSFAIIGLVTRGEVMVGVTLGLIDDLERA